MQTVRRDRKVHRGLTGEEVGYFQIGGSAYCLSLVVLGQDMHVPHHLSQASRTTGSAGFTAS